MIQRTVILLALLIAAAPSSAQNKLLTSADLGTTVQPYDADTAAFAACAGTASTLCYSTGAGTMSSASITAAGLAVVGAADAAAQRTALGLGTLATQSGTFSGTSSGTNTGDQTLTSLGATAAAQTVLDDTTVAAMVDTLGGASSTGTGGIVRATSPTLVTPTLGVATATTLGVGGAADVALTVRTETGRPLHLYRASNDIGAASIAGFKSRGTLASPSQVLSGDAIAFINALSYTSAGSYATSGNAGFYATEAHTGTAQGTRFMVATMPSGSNTLYEHFSVSPLGNVHICTAATAPTDPTSATNTLVMHDGTAPTSSPTGTAQLYADDVAGTVEMRVRDSAGNATTISPHNFARVPGGRSEPMAWSYYSERDGSYVAVDMMRAMRLLEQLSGEQLVTVGKLADAAPENDVDEAVAAIEREAMNSGTDEQKARVMALHAQLSESRASMRGALDAYAALLDAGAIAAPDDVSAKLRRVLARPAANDGRPGRAAGGRQ